MKAEHQYLKPLNIEMNGIVDSRSFKDRKDSRSKEWKAQRKKYGFDERETWDLDFTMCCWIYEHLKMFKDVNPIATEKEKFLIPILQKDWTEKMEERNLEEVLDIVCEGLEGYILETDEIMRSNAVISKAKNAYKILAIVFPALWW